MGCGTGVVKFVMFLFNFVFVCGGILMVTAGALVLTGYQNYEHVADLDSYKAPPILLIAVGSAVFLIAFMGCCGVLRESNCMMMTYAVFLAIILLVQIGIAVAAAYYENDFKEILHKGLEKSIPKYDERKEIKETWDSMQSNLKCCGFDKYTDWKVRNAIPDSCCKERSDNCAENVSFNDEYEAGKKIYVEGCVTKALSDLKIKYVIIAAAVIGGIELLGVIFSCCLAARFRRKNYA